jgi:hypothetical protein
MLEAYHPELYPQCLLRTLATVGRTLDHLAIEPQPPLEGLCVESLRDLALLHGEHFSALRVVMSGGGTVETTGASAEMLQLEDFGVLERSPLEVKRMFIADPKLLTICELQPAHEGALPAIPQHLEQLLQKAEGKVLELLARRDLVPSIIASLDLSGTNMGPACAAACLLGANNVPEWGLASMGLPSSDFPCFAFEGRPALLCGLCCPFREAVAARPVGQPWQG